MNSHKSPSIKVAVNKGKTYYWCGCGLSQKQPFCDGAHKKDSHGQKPVTYTALADKFISFCTCKKTQLPPICDGSHKVDCLTNNANDCDVISGDSKVSSLNKTLI
jgi:CDGSH-type Zn-finger protein